MTERNVSQVPYFLSWQILVIIYYHLASHMNFNAHTMNNMEKCPASPWHLVNTNPISTGMHRTKTYGSRCTENWTSGEQSAACWGCLKSDSTCQIKCCCSICYVVSDIWYNHKYFFNINMNSYFVALHSLMSYGITFCWNSGIKRHLWTMAATKWKVSSMEIISKLIILPFASEHPLSVLSLIVGMNKFWTNSNIGYIIWI